jgi:tetratricopeptide (TPR) repeat protein
MDASTTRAHLLMEQGRYELAEQELRQALAANPQDADIQALLAICLPNREKFEEAVDFGRKAVGLEPDSSFCQYALAVALFHRDDHVSNKQTLISNMREFQEAEVCINEAIRLDPHEANQFALLSSIRLARQQWQGALDAAMQGLAINPENVSCINCRATALVKLGRQDEASESLEGALAKDPEDSHTHANKGWALLHQGKPQQALESFREALRIDPSNEYARLGIIEALKARNFIYRWMLAYFLWMSRLSTGARWGVILGGYFLIRFLGGVERTNAQLRPYILPIQILYALFVILTWTAPHIFNLLLRMDKFGRYALNEDETIGANAVGACLMTGMTMIAVGIVLESGLLIIAGVGCIGLMIPVGGTFTREGRARKLLGLYTLGLIGVGIAAVVLAMMKSPEASSLGGIFAIGLMVFGWVANIMATR